MSNLGLLFQMVDASLPVGGFVYSMGMESAVKSKLVNNEEDLVRYLSTYVDQLISFEFPFIDAAYSLWKNPNAWKSLMTDYHAMLMNPFLEKSSLVLGKNWLRLYTNLYTSKEMDYFSTHIKKNNNTKLHFTVIFGLITKAMNVTSQDAKEVYLYAALRDQISALTRLGVVGPVGGQKLLTGVLRTTAKKIKNYQSIPHTEAYKSAYLLEITQLNHNFIYSKLFQN